MKLKATKLQKLIFAFFCLGTSSIFTLVASSYEYSNCPYKVVEAIEVANGVKDIIRRISWAILVAVANLVDYIDEGVTYLMDSRGYNLVQKAFPEIDTHPMAVAILSLTVIFAGILLMFNVDKLKISDTLRNILVAACIIFALPLLTGSLVELKEAGYNDADNLSYNSASKANGNTIYHGLGETILAKHTMDVEQSVIGNREIDFDDTGAFNNPKSIYSLRYTATIDNSQFHLKVLDYDTLEVEQMAFQSLTEEDMMSLLGLSKEYEVWNNPTLFSGNAPLVTYEILENPSNVLAKVDTTTGITHYTNPATGEPIEPTIYSVNRSLYFRSQILGLAGYYVPGFSGPNPNGIIPQVDSMTADISSANYNNLKNSSSVHEALKYIKKNLVFELNVDYNKSAALNNPNVLGNITTAELIDEYTFGQMGVTEKIEQRISNWGTGVERLYKYRVDFWQCLIMLILVGISLVFASIKLAGLLYDMMFINIIVPIVAATDTTGNGRGKKALTELVTTYVLFIVVVFILKIYITTVDVIISTDINLVAKYALIIAGAKFVIDGPDIIVKLTGSDAGIKSGYGALMGVRAAASMAHGAAHSVTGAAHTVTNTASRVSHTTASVGSTILNGAAGGVAGTASAATSAFEASRDAGGGILRSAANAAAAMPTGAVGGSIGGAFGHEGNAISRGAETGGRIGETLGSPVSSLVRHGADGNSGGSTLSASPTASAAAAGAATGAVVGTAAALGAKGEKGDTGPAGPQGEQGERGAEGQRGEQGDRGDVVQEAQAAAQAQVDSSAGSSYGNAFGDTASVSPSASPTSSSPVSSPVSSSPASSVSAPSSAAPISNPSPTFAESERRAESATPTFTEQQKAVERPQSNLDK